MELIALIVQQEELKLQEICIEINAMQTTLNDTFSFLPDLKTHLEKVNVNITRMEKSIVDTKRRKYQRDIKDYAEDKVYTWNSDRKHLRPILKKEAIPPRVSV